jgi:hypothetical protein
MSFAGFCWFIVDFQRYWNVEIRCNEQNQTAGVGVKASAFFIDGIRPKDYICRKEAQLFKVWGYIWGYGQF